MPKTATAKTAPKMTRQQKLAQKLRENLKRRKVQTRQRNLAQPDTSETKP